MYKRAVKVAATNSDTIAHKDNSGTAGVGSGLDVGPFGSSVGDELEVAIGVGEIAGSAVGWLVDEAVGVCEGCGVGFVAGS